MINPAVVVRPHLLRKERLKTERNYPRGARTHSEELEELREEALLKLRGRVFC